MDTYLGAAGTVVRTSAWETVEIVQKVEQVKRVRRVEWVCSGASFVASVPTLSTSQLP
jgi:hypothetical protein